MTVTPIAIPTRAEVPTSPARPRVMFASYHCYHDPSSGAAICTRDLFAALAARGWRCGALTGPFLDDPLAPPIGTALHGRPGVTFARGTAGACAFTIHTVEGPGGFPTTVFAPDPPAAARSPSQTETAAFCALLRDVLNRFRPNVVLTYGGDPASRAVADAARRIGAKVVFWLHNLAYTDASAFTGCDAVVVPSAFSRDYYRKAIGLDCVALPPVLDVDRVTVDRPGGGRFVTFVNPDPAKGVYWFARLAQVLGGTRPDVPLLTVEGRARADWVARCGVDLSAVTSVHKMANTPDPRQFYHVTRVALVPSVVSESFGRVAVEAMFNGIPVLASDRGALPEVLGTGGRCVPLPGWLTPETRTPPSIDDVKPWTDTILDLWDDPTRYEAASMAARAASMTWHPDAVVPRWEQFLSELSS